MGISYSVEVDEERSAKAMGRELTISKKDAVELCRHVKGMPTGEAWDTLRAIADGEEPVPLKKHNSGAGHRSDIDGWDAGGYPKKAAEALLDVLYNAEANADNQGYDPDEMVVDHIAAHKVGESRGMKPRAMGRASNWNSDLVDVEVVLLQEDYEPSEPPEKEEEEQETEAEGEEEVSEAEEAEEDEEETEEEEETQVPEELTDIDAVGEAKAESLREAGFEGVEDIREAAQDEIAEAEGIGKALAARIKADVGDVDVGVEEEVEETEETEEDEEETDVADAEAEEEAEEAEEDEEVEETEAEDADSEKDDAEDEGGDR